MYQTSKYKHIFGYLAFTKHKYYIRNATLTTIAGLFFSFSLFLVLLFPPAALHIYSEAVSG